MYLREWVEVFGLENIHVMRLEDWKEDPIGELEGLMKYLELGLYGLFTSIFPIKYGNNGQICVSCSVFEQRRIGLPVYLFGTMRAAVSEALTASLR